MKTNNSLDLHAVLAQHNKGRDPERLAMKYAKMSESAFSFFRGASPLYWLRVKEAAGRIKVTCPLSAVPNCVGKNYRFISLSGKKA
jgi:uncharacterized protein (DUF2252 family)